VSLHDPLPRDAVLAKEVWSIRKGVRQPLVRAGVALSDSIRAGLVRAGVASVWVDDAASEGISPDDVLSPELRGRASETIGKMLRESSRGDDARVGSRQLDRMEDVVRSITRELSGSPAVLGAFADLQTADGDTATHSLNVAVIGLVVAQRAMRERGWQDWKGVTHRNADVERLTKLGLGLVLHDVGKIMVPSEVLTKPGALDEDEMALIREHPTQGLRMLDPNEVSSLARVVVGDHHERMDGSGYPAGKIGDQIHEHARIAAIADTYDAVASRRVYQPERTNQAAWELVQELGHVGKLDPGLTAIFGRAIAPYPEGTEVALEDGRRALVATVSEAAADRPVVRVIEEPGAGPVTPYEVDLASERGVRIADAVAPSGPRSADRVAERLVAAG
jgi:HD-GYP domain-containing protein (c-di-GMP phosphodiesterase class II)